MSIYQTVNRAPTRKWLGLAVLGVALSVALAVRLYLLIKANWMADYDEAMIGLIALDITRGARPVFLYGQPYLGTLEPFLIAGVFGLFGVGREALKVVPLAMSLMWVITSYLLARHLWGQRAALLAAMVAALPPLYVLVHVVRAWGATVETMALGNLILLVALRVTEATRSRSRTLWCAVLGFTIGFCFWLHWLGAFYVLAALVYVLLRQPHIALNRGSWLAVPTFFVGSLPLWLYNVSNNWHTFRFLLGPGRPETAEVESKAVALDLVSRLIPRTLGVGPSVWPWLPWLGVLIVTVAVLLLVAHTARCRWRGEPSSSEIVLLFAVSVPVLYLLSGFSRAAINPYGIDATGRYVMVLFGAVPLVMAFLYSIVPHRIAVLATIVLLAVNLAGVLVADGSQVLQSPYYNRAPASYETVIAALREENVRHVWTDLGLGQPLMLESQGEIVTADYLDHINGGLPRFPDALEAVKRADRTAYLVAVLPGQIGPLERELQRLGVTYRKREIGSLALLVPEERVEPSTVVTGLGMQY